MKELSQDAEHALLDQVMLKKEEACKKIISQYKDFAFNIAYQVLRDYQDAEEVTQDAFINAFRGLKNFNRKSKFSSWLYRITFNSALGKLRKRKNRYSELSEVECQNVASIPVEDTLAEMKSHERQKYLSKAIHMLSEKDRVLISLFYFQECSMEEVSKITNLSLTNTKVKIFRIRKQLKKNLSFLLKEEVVSLL